MTPEKRRAVLKCTASAVAATVVTGCFLTIPKIAEAIPAPFVSLLMFSPPQSPIVALRPEPDPHESIWWDESDESVESSAPEEDSREEEVLPPPEDAITVMAESFCWYKPEEEPTLNLINRTSYKVDLPSFLNKELPIKAMPSDQKQPLVLILHTHGTEAYLPDNVEYYLPDEDFRSANPEETVVFVGQAIAATLENLGIPTLHDTTMHDAENFNQAYSNSANAIHRYLEEYPSIRYVLDVHRDSIFGENNVCEKTLTTINGKETAQVMLVVGTDESGSAHPDWRKNLTVAAHLEEHLNALYPTLARPVNLREHGFNQWLSPGSMIVEVGSCGNTREEAVTAGVFFAKSFAALVKAAH